MTIIDQETFLKLPTPEVAKLVRAAGPQVCVFPINGTRRWFMLEHAQDSKHDSQQDFVVLAEKRQIELHQMCFDHGLDTLITPIFGLKHFMRSGEYMQKFASHAMARLATHPDFLSFYQKYKVRVRFYGDYRKHLKETPFAYLSDLFDQITKDTTHNNNHRLFFGVFANDATEMVAECSVQHFQETGRVPTRDELVERYYGEYVEPASLFIGFSKFKVYDYPLLGLGAENLYFTIAPSLYLNDYQLRNILYDHIYSRQVEEVDYTEMPKQDFQFLTGFYQENRQNTFGLGELHGGIWIPLPQVKLPSK